MAAVAVAILVIENQRYWSSGVTGRRVARSAYPAAALLTTPSGPATATDSPGIPEVAATSATMSWIRVRVSMW
jgi:hypothetical protein